MRRLIFLSVLCSLLLAAPAGAQLTHIRAGVSAAGVDLSGLTVTEATAKLDAELALRLAPDLLIGVAGKPWVLKMADAKLKLDSSRTAKRALYAQADVTQVVPAISHSRLAVRTFVADIAKQVGKPARDAKIKITLRHIYRERSRPGRGLDVAAAAKAIDAAIDHPAAPRVLHQPLTRVRAKVNANDLARVYNTVIAIDQAHFKLRLFKGLKFRKSYGVAVGQPAFPTPRGRFAIQSKQVNPVWSVPNSPWAGELQGTTVEGGSAANPLKARWMGIANGVGIHGTGDDYSIGSRASHGCIRMHVPDVIDLFKRVPVGTPVLIQ
ncbi:MAG TPA: L,D-transpeptidase family protein [Solirubrobacteraceae bacterium]|nr:L,D-transpeptidase family protein [Solirubrobacteraceae bacterium]